MEERMKSRILRAVVAVPVVIRLLISVAVILAVSLPVQAQTDPNLENGFKPYGTYSGSNIDTINLENGNLMLHVRMPFAYPQRGKLQPSYFLGVSSKQWTVNNWCAPSVCYSWNPPFQRSVPPIPVLQGLGFDNSLDMVVMRTATWATDAINPGLACCSSDSVTAVVTADGASHKVAPVEWVTNSTGDSSYPATNVTVDVSGYTVRESGPDANFVPTGVAVQDRAGNVSAITPYGSLNCTVSTKPDGEPPPNNGTIVTKNCTQAARITKWTDSNGNQIVLNGQDTLGRSATIQGFSGTQSTTDYTGCFSPASQPITSATISNYTGFNGVTNQVKVCYSNIALSTSFGVANVSEYSNSSVQVIVSVVFLADNSTWSFQYDSYGNVTYVGLPLGGNIQYQWETVSLPSPPPPLHSYATPASRAVSKRTVTDANGNSYVTNYQYGSATYPNPLTNVTTDPLGNDTVSTFSTLTTDQTTNAPFGNNDVGAYYVTTTKKYQGSQGSGTLLKQEDLQYYSNGQTSISSVVNGFVTQVTTTVNGKVSRVTRTPDSGGYGANGPNFGVVTVEKKYDFGSGQPGALLNETDTSYQWQSNANYLVASLIDLPATVQIKDPNGTLCAETDNSYDDPNRLIAFSGTIPNHGAPPNAVRGNPTSTSRKLSTTACSITSSTPSVSSYINWYDTGEIYQQIDPLGNITATHTYDLAYDGAYSTKTCNALSQCVSGTYDFSTGLLTSFTNANATQQASGNTPGDTAHTSFYAYDVLSRMTQATFPPDPGNNNAQAVTQFTYPVPLSLPFTVTRSKSVTAGQMDSVTSTFDGLGRVYKTVHTTAGNATVVTQYDGLDHVISVTNPYFSTSDATYGTVQSQYDALGRVTQVTAQDGGISTSDYSNFPTVTITDPAGKMRRSRTDGLGQLVEVDEPGPGANGPGTPGGGSINISGSLSSTTGGGTKATGSFTVDGQAYCYRPWICNDTCVKGPNTCDSGTVSVAVNGVTYSTAYNTSKTAAAVASALAAQMTGSPVSAADQGNGTANLTADVPGPNYSMSWNVVSNNSTNFNPPSVSVTLSGSSLTGGVYPTTTYDSGTVTVTVGGFQASASYNQNLNNTASALAQALTNALNASGSPVTASTSGTTITITAKGVGTATNFAVTGSSTASFTASSTTLSGGTNPGGINAAYVTNYSYDVLGNLLQVNQLGDGSQAARVRSFTYDTLSRLLTSQNPESGTISYSYDADGNMLQKTAPAPNALPGSTATQTISYCYDQINRVTGKAYSAQSCTNGLLPAGTAVVSYVYDAGGSATNAIGRLTSLTDQAGSASYAYNILGRMTSESRTILGSPNDITDSIGYGYHLNGSLKTLTYPSNAVITYMPDSAGRDTSAVDKANGINYVTAATFGPEDGVTGFVNGSNSSFAGITSSFSYNKRLQPVNMAAATPNATVFSVTYDFHLGTGDDGNVFAINNNKDTSRNQTFTYDQLNRLSSAQNAGSDCTKTTANGKTEYWGNSYDYDAWGNLISKTVTKCSAENLSVTALANNQIAGYTYDAAGNMTSNPTDGVSATYDAENRMATATKNGVTTTYAYDAAGNRVKKANGSTGTLYWYAVVGVIAESDLAGNPQHEYIFFGGQRIARKDLPGNAVSYYFSDHLQRASVITDSVGNIRAESDYYPFGGELQILNNDSNDYKFTGKKRDLETGLDYFGARYYSSAFGRFLSPDWSAGPTTVPYAHLDKPQTLNLYSYVDNNPINGIDADGHAPREYMVAPVGSWGLDTMMSDGTGTTTDSGEDGAAIDAENAMIAAYNQQVDSYNAQVAAYNAGLEQGGGSSSQQAGTAVSTVKSYIEQEAKKFGIPVALALAVAAKESFFNVNVKKGGAGEVGLYQIKPSNAGKKFTDSSGKTFKLDFKQAASNWRYNVRAGLAILNAAYKYGKSHDPTHPIEATFAYYNDGSRWSYYVFPFTAVHAHVYGSYDRNGFYVKGYMDYYQDFGGK
jgi:RHS repeat-associated protein